MAVASFPAACSERPVPKDPKIKDAESHVSNRPETLALPLHVPTRGICALPNPAPPASKKSVCANVRLLSRPPTTTSAPKKPRRKVLPKLTPHENIYTVPNILTFSRLLAAPVVGYLVLHDHHAWAVGLFAYAGITDLVDGWIARKWNLQTVVGTVIDPMADKTLMTILTVCLAVKGALPGQLTTTSPHSL